VFILVVSFSETRPSPGGTLCGHYADGAMGRNPLQHDPEKWTPVFSDKIVLKQSDAANL